MNEGRFKDGKEDGIWTSWWGDGTKSHEGEYEEGELVKFIGRWNQDGTIKNDPFWWE